MRLFVVPAAYQMEIESAVRRAVDQVWLDMNRRENGAPRLIPDMMIDAERKGDVFIVVGVAKDSLAAAIDKIDSSHMALVKAG